MDWLDLEEESIAFNYFVEQFAEVTKMDFNFPILIPKLVRLQSEMIRDEESDRKLSQLEDRSLGEVNVPLSSKWIRQQVLEERLPPVGLAKHSDLQWNTIRIQAEEQEPNRIKNVVNPSDYDKVEVEPERAFYLGKTLNRLEKEDCVELLRRYSNVFVWTPLDLHGILLELGEHHIGLINGAILARQ